jgi:hypothetical protein
MIPCCIAFGQSAGVAAAMAVQKHVAPVGVDTNALRAELTQQGVYLGDISIGEAR